jgi:hypothetical protein
VQGRILPARQKVLSTRPTPQQGSTSKSRKKWPNIADHIHDTLQNRIIYSLAIEKIYSLTTA